MKVKYSPTLDYERWARSWSRFLGSQPEGDSVNIGDLASVTKPYNLVRPRGDLFGWESNHESNVNNIW